MGEDSVLSSLSCVLWLRIEDVITIEDVWRPLKADYLLATCVPLALKTIQGCFIRLRALQAR